MSDFGSVQNIGVLVAELKSITDTLDGYILADEPTLTDVDEIVELSGTLRRIAIALLPNHIARKKCVNVKKYSDNVVLLKRY